MVENLAQYMEGKKCKGFKAIPHYFRDGDYLTFYASDEPCYSKRVDEHLSVYFGMNTKKLVGCKIKGISHLLETANIFGVSVQGDDTSINFLFFAAAMRDESDRLKELSQKLDANLRLKDCIGVG